MYQNFVITMVLAATVTFSHAGIKSACVPESTDDEQANSRIDRDHTGLDPARFGVDKQQYGLDPARFGVDKQRYGLDPARFGSDPKRCDTNPR